MAQLDRQFIAYIRGSTDDQEITIEAQRDRVRAFALANDLPLARVVEDKGESAKSLERPGMAEVLHFLDVGGAGLLVTKLDRLTRSVRDFCFLLEEYFARPGGPVLLSASESVDARSAAGRLPLKIMMCVGEWERETIVERTVVAKEHKKSKGERIGNIPYGLMLDSDLKTLVACPSEVSTLEYLVKLRGQGRTLRSIAEELDRMGFATRSGRPWAPSTVGKLAGQIFEDLEPESGD
jgi:DNA invertase Pin-like site-specific DNA recombinase